MSSYSIGQGNCFKKMHELPWQLEYVFQLPRPFGNTMVDCYVSGVYMGLPSPILAGRYEFQNVSHSGRNSINKNDFLLTGCSHSYWQERLSSLPFGELMTKIDQKCLTILKGRLFHVNINGWEVWPTVCSCIPSFAYHVLRVWGSGFRLSTPGNETYHTFTFTV